MTDTEAKMQLVRDYMTTAQLFGAETTLPAAPWFAEFTAKLVLANTTIIEGKLFRATDMLAKNPFKLKTCAKNLEEDAKRFQEIHSSFDVWGNLLPACKQMIEEATLMRRSRG